jgi:signal transduction histidine kinase
LSIEAPIRQVTRAALALARGEPASILAERGPSELAGLKTAFNYLAGRLRQLEEARRRLLANLVHELGRPLGALRSAVQALQKGATQDPVLTAELLSGMDSELVRLQALLGELTHLYDQAFGSLELDRKLVEILPWFSEVAAPWQAAVRSKGLEMVLDVDPSLPPHSLDPLRMSQALGNLLSNAVKFTPAGGKISVVVGRRGSDLVFRVTDTGLGIPPEDLDKIFTPFYRGAQGKRFSEGMGLGLSIARELARAHGGDLTVTSTPGQGSTFELAVPAAVSP